MNLISSICKAPRGFEFRSIPREIIVDLENYHFHYQDSLGVSKKGSPLYPKHDLVSLEGDTDDYHQSLLLLLRKIGI